MLPHHAVGRIRRSGVLFELCEQHLHHALKAVLVVGRVDGQLGVVVLPRRQHHRARQSRGVTRERARDDRQCRSGLVAERDVMFDRASRCRDGARGQLGGRDGFRCAGAVDAVQQLARVGEPGGWRERALHERATGVLVLDRQHRRLHLARAGPAQQRDQQLDARALDPHRLLEGERPEPGRGARADPLVGEALRARSRARGERLGGQHAERREHPRRTLVAARLDRLHDREPDVIWHVGLLDRHEHGGGELLQRGRIVERCRVVEHRDERRDDLLAQDL